MANPVARTYSSGGSTSKSIPHPPSVSALSLTISGLQCKIYGLSELASTAAQTTCLWLLHPRLQTQECMAPFAAQFIHTHNTRNHDQTRGFIAISFDQRNHGTREISPTANKAWREGNETHALDMFSCYHGTSVDCSQLLDYLSAYLFAAHPEKGISITKNVVMGISLGGHAAWHVLLHDPRFDAGIVVIGCPDYRALMEDRARLSRRESYKRDGGFVGSTDFPRGLQDAVEKYDPAGLFWKGSHRSQDRGDARSSGTPDDESEKSVHALIKAKLGGKRILNLAGGSDKLVPYAIGKPFLDWLKNITGKGGDLENAGIEIKDIVVPGCGHEVPPVMVEEMERWLLDVLGTGEQNKRSQSGNNGRDSRI